MTDPCNVTEILNQLVQNRFGNLRRRNISNNDRELAGHLLKIITDSQNGVTTCTEAEWSLELDEEGHHLPSDNEESSEEQLSQTSSQEWETFSVVESNFESESFTMDYMKSSVDCFDKYGWHRVQQRFKRVKHRRYLSRFRTYIQQNGTLADKLKILHSMLFDKFSKLLLKREIIHDFDLKRWALQIAQGIDLQQFKASDTWILSFKKSHNIVSRKITKFVSKACLEDAEIISQTATNFINFAKGRMTAYVQDNIVNTDQSGFNYLLKSNRMLAIQGEKTTVAKTESKNKQTHSYTIQPTISMSGKLVGPLYICLQEQDGKFGKIVQRSVDQLSRKCRNVVIKCSKSGKLQKDLVRFWANNVMYPSTDYKYLLLLDSWKGQTDSELFFCDDQDKECERMYIPENTTDQIQPLDVYGFRQWKIFVRKMTSRVILDEIPIDLTIRDNIIVMHSLIHNQLSASLFKNMWMYAWYKSGYLPVKPANFVNVRRALFEPAVEKCQDAHNCQNIQFIRCAHCRMYLCFTHFFDAYHFHEPEAHDLIMDMPDMNQII